MLSKNYKILNLMALLIATGWLVASFDWEPLVVFVSLFASYILLLLQDSNKAILDTDRKLFQQFISSLPQRSISYIQNKSSKTIYHEEELKPFFEFESIWSDTHHTFLIKQLEKKKNALYKSISNFTAVIARNTFSNSNPNLNSVPYEWATDDKQKYETICRKIAEAQMDVVEKYDKFILFAKKKLSV